jgi:hypothetical protein
VTTSDCGDGGLLSYRGPASGCCSQFHPPCRSSLPCWVGSSGRCGRAHQFMAAFMKNSLEYNVGRRWFPAVAIAGDEMENCLDGEKEASRIHWLDNARNPLRNGCDGMIMTIGRVRKIRQNGEDKR